MSASGASYDMKNLSDQYAILTDLLKDRGDAAIVGHFNHFIDFYANRDTTHKAGAEITVGLESKLDSTSLEEGVGGKISYEDIQKMLLLNFQAYKAADCAASENGGTILAYHDGSSYTDLTSDFGLRTLFEDNLAHAERLYSRITVGSGGQEHGVMYNRYVKPEFSDSETAELSQGETYLKSEVLLDSEEVNKAAYDFLQTLKSDLEAVTDNETSIALDYNNDSNLSALFGISSPLKINNSRQYERFQNIFFNYAESINPESSEKTVILKDLVDGIMMTSAYDESIQQYKNRESQGSTAFGASYTFAEFKADHLYAQAKLEELVNHFIRAEFAIYQDSNLYVDFSAEDTFPETITIKTDIQDPVAHATLIETDEPFDTLDMAHFTIIEERTLTDEAVDSVGLFENFTAYPKYRKLGTFDSSTNTITFDMSSTESEDGINSVNLDSTKDYLIVLSLHTEGSPTDEHNFLPLAVTNQNEKQVYVYHYIDNTFTAADIDITPATSTDDTEPNITSSITEATTSEQGTNTALTHKITTTITPGSDGPPLPANGYTTAIVTEPTSTASFFNFFQTANALSAADAATICADSNITNAITFDGALTSEQSIESVVTIPPDAGTYYVCQGINGVYSPVATIDVLEGGEVIIQDGVIDADDDGLTENTEAEEGLNDNDANNDADSDGIPDAFEFFNGLNPNDEADAEEDEDGDGLTNLQEFTEDTDINNEDSDEDGMNDGFEVDNELDPNNDEDANEDEDGDDLTNLEEFRAGTDPNDSDSDDDGELDGDDETPITATDTDEDGIPDSTDNCPGTTNTDQADADEDGTGDACDTRPNGEPELDSSIDKDITIGSNSVILTIKGKNLVDEKTSGNTYKLKTSTGSPAAEAEQVVSDSDGNITISFGAVLPCMESTCAAYELHMVDSVGEVNLGLKVSIAKFNVISPQNGVSLTRPGITFQCLVSEDYKYQVTLKQGSTVVETISDIDCLDDQATATLANDLTAGATYSVIVAVKDALGDTVGSNYQAYSFTTSNTFLLSGEQMQSLTYACGQQRPETTDANGVTLPGTSNVVIAGQTANCAISNPFTNATINSNYKIKFGESTPDTNAVQIQSVSTGFSALNIPVPTNTADNKIVLFVPNSSGTNQKFTASSTLTIEASNGGSGTEVTGADLTDLVEIDIDNDIEIGEEIDMEVFIPEGLNVHFLQVAFEGNEDDRDTEDEKGMIFRYCQEDITDLLETRDQRDTMEDLCEDFSDDDILEGPLEVEIENFDTSRISVEGDYDIVIDMFIEGEAEQTAKSNTAYAQDVQLLQTRIRIENAFEAEDNEFDAGRGGWGSIGFPGFNPGVIVGSVQQCGQIFVDLRGGHQICQDIMYLYDKNLYQGIQMGPNIVSGISQPAVRAHIFAFVAQVLNTYRNAPRMAPDLYALSQYYSDLPFEVISNPQQQWWVAPLYTLSTYNYVSGDSQYRARPFDPITQAQAAKLIGMATGLIPAQLAQINPWYAQIVSQYLTYGLNLNPDAPATMGDILILLSRSMQIMENPSLYSVQNPYMGTSGYQSNGYNTQFVQGGYGTQYYSQAGYGQGYGQPYGQTQGYFY